MGIMRVLLECIPVLLGIKPAVDAYQVATPEIRQRGQSVNSKTEMTASRSAEMFAEAIP